MSTNSIGNKEFTTTLEYMAQYSGSKCLTSKILSADQKLTKKKIAVMQQFAHVSKHALKGEVVTTTTYYHSVNSVCCGCC